MDKNTFLNLLLWYGLYFKDLFLMGLFFYIILDAKVNVRKLILFSFVLSLIGLLPNIILPVPLKMFFSLLLVILGSVFILKFSIFKSIFITFLAQIILILCDLIAYLFLNSLNISRDQMLNNIYFWFLGNLVNSFVFILIIIITLYSKIKITFDEDIIKKRNIGIALNILITSLLITPNIIFICTAPPQTPKSIIMFNIFAIIIFFSLGIYNILKNNELEIKKNELEYQKLYNKTLNDLIDGLRKFKHDFANILHAINGYVSTNDMKGLKKYFSELLEDYRPITNLTYLNAGIIKNPSVYGVIASKLNMADTQGIKMNVEITSDLNHAEIKIYELCKILGILLDNAIEAATQTPEKLVNLVIKFNQMENNYTIIVENTYQGEIKISELFKKGYSTKGEGRGLGLWEVKNITNNYKSTNLKTTIKNGLFRQELSIQANFLKKAI